MGILISNFKKALFIGAGLCMFDEFSVHKVIRLTLHIIKY